MYNKIKYLDKYHNQNKPDYIVYFLQVSHSPTIFKIGKTNRLKYRMINLKQAFFFDTNLYHQINCCCNTHALELERKIQKELSIYKIKNEWFNVPLETMKQILTHSICSEVLPNYTDGTCSKPKLKPSN